MYVRLRSFPVWCSVPLFFWTYIVWTSLLILKGGLFLAKLRNFGSHLLKTFRQIKKIPCEIWTSLGKVKVCPKWLSTSNSNSSYFFFFFFLNKVFLHLTHYITKCYLRNVIHKKLKINNNFSSHKITKTPIYQDFYQITCGMIQMDRLWKFVLPAEFNHWLHKRLCIVLWSAWMWAYSPIYITLLFQSWILVVDMVEWQLCNTLLL